MHHALAHLAEVGEESDISRLSERMATGLLRGNRLSTVMRQQPGAFGPFHCSMVRMGEETGALVLVLEQLADYEEATYTLQNLLISRLTYPAILLVFAVGMLILLPAFCLEGLFDVLERSSVELPLLSVAFISCSRLLRHPLVLIAIALSLVGLVLMLRRAWASDSYREFIARALQAVPVVGNVWTTYSVATFSQALALQLRVGLSPLKALTTSANLVVNPQLRQDVEYAVQAIKNGSTLGGSLEQADSFPVLLRSVIAVGEETGKLPELLSRMARFYGEQMEHSLEVLASVLEPMILCLMGVIFGVMLVAVMTPLVSLVQTL